MGAILEVQVLPRADHSERSEVQLRKGDQAWGGSTERTRESRYTNRMEGGVWQGEQANNCEAVVVKNPDDVDAAIVRGRIAFLPGEILPCA
jgi:hypothetical protein